MDGWTAIDSSRELCAKTIRLWPEDLKKGQAERQVDRKSPKTITQKKENVLLLLEIIPTPMFHLSSFSLAELQFWIAICTTSTAVLQRTELDHRIAALY
jgi:hypothetical protein